jgi:hypothetical protein
LEQVGEVYRKIVETEGASPEEFETLRSLAHRLVEREGVDAILLAGTDCRLYFGRKTRIFPIWMECGRTSKQSWAMSQFDLLVQRHDQFFGNVSA